MTAPRSRARRAAVRMLGRALRSLPWPGRAAACRCDHVAVLDGRTLTGQVDMSALATTADRSRGALRFTRRGATRMVPFSVLDPSSAGVFRFAALLEPDGTPLLDTGPWRVEVIAEDGAVPAMAAADDAGGGPTRWNPRSPATGVRYRPGADLAGRFVVTVETYDPHAEVDRIATGEHGVEISGRVVGLDVQPGAATSTLTEQSGDRRLELPCHVDGTTFVLTVPPDTPLGDAGRWTATLRIGESGPLTLARALTDLRNPSAFRYSAADLAGGARITPSFVGGGELVLTVSAPADAPPPNPEPQA